MEEALRAAVKQVWEGSDRSYWIALIDQDPAAVGDHVIASLPSEIDRMELLSAAVKALANGYLHLRSVFPVETDLPESPTGFLPVPDSESTQIARLVVLGLNALVGHLPVSYGSENDGSLFVNIVAMPGEGRRAAKSTKGMRGHTDAVSFPFPGEFDPIFKRIAPSPDTVCLAALRNPQDIPTMIIPLGSVLQRLMPHHIAELEKMNYLVNCQGTFKDGTKNLLGQAHQAADVSLLKPTGEGEYWARFSHSNVVPVIDAKIHSQQALDKFSKACEEEALPVVIAGGDVLLINNRRALHGRAEVGKEVGGRARWLLRSYGLLPGHIRAGSFHDNSRFKLWP